MNTIKIKFIAKNDILIILPLLKILNDFTSDEVLKERILKMSNQHYKCLGVFDNKKLIGIAGLWFLTRHYAGNVIEPDHVIIDESYRNLGLGKKLFDFIHHYAQNNNYDAIELNTYVENIKSHNFYERMNYKKLGFHFVKKF